MDAEAVIAAPDAAQMASHICSDLDVLEHERERHRQRADKFGVQYTEPGQRRDLRHVARKEQALERAEARPSGFSPGFDMYSEVSTPPYDCSQFRHASRTRQQKMEQIARRRQRAARFHTSDTLQSYKPAVDMEEAAKRKQRAEKYGTEYIQEDGAGLMDVDLLESKRDVAPSETRRLEAIHLYGVDLMNTKEVLSYFTQFSPVFVEWLDDSSCNVLFGDTYTAKRAIFAIGKPLPPEDIPEGQELSMDVTDLEKLWHKGPDFVKSGTSIPLIFRVATVADQRPEPGTHTTRRLWQTNTKDGTAARQQGRKMPNAALHPALDMALPTQRKKKKPKKRKGGDIEMADAQASSTQDDGGSGASNPVADDDVRVNQRSSLHGQRQELRRQRPKVTGLFSAAAAGILLPKRPGRAAADESLEASVHPAIMTSAPLPRETVSYADL